VEWVNGNVDDLAGVTDIRVIDSAGGVIMDAALCTHFFSPHSKNSRVIFQVLKD
jgi:hypothetical protein